MIDPISVARASHSRSLAPTVRKMSSAHSRFRCVTKLPPPSVSVSAVATAAVINVGTATLGALIGAGGYGQPIFAGVRLDNFNLILEGAVPAALLALVVQGLFELAERRLVPRGLRLKTNASI